MSHQSCANSCKVKSLVSLLYVSMSYSIQCTATVYLHDHRVQLLQLLAAQGGSQHRLNKQQKAVKPNRQSSSRVLTLKYSTTTVSLHVSDHTLCMYTITLTLNTHYYCITADIPSHTVHVHNNRHLIYIDDLYRYIYIYIYLKLQVVEEGAESPV
jgi:hypothetical protein